MRQQFFLPLATYPEANADAVAANAVAIASRFGAELHALAINPDIPPVSNALSKLLLDTPQMIRDAEASSRRRGQELLALVKARAGQAGVVASVAETAAPLAAIGDVACRHARYYDLALLGLEIGNTTARMVAEAVVFGAGRPALMLPGVLPERTGHVAVAWDGSRVAARALADARPFLEKASRVSVMTVVDEKKLQDADAVERLAASLRHAGLAADAVAVRIGDAAIGAGLQEKAIALGADLLVMGGYGHSRIRDFVLGGATEGVLADLRMPVLLSH
ncbi:universal stress protein [Aminobacter sp. BE322]|uniref:universal stress protein n=1 Tax=unclassified Aminobacter TaxID=2644704 RepID=UPI003D1E4EE5